MTLSSVPAFAAPGDSIKRTEPVARKEAADESSTVQLKYSYTNMPWEDLETSTAKFAPKTNWNTLYPEKRLRLEKKSPVARKDLAPAGNFETYAKTYPGLYSAVSGLPMGQVPELMMKPSESKKPVYPNGFYKAPPKKPVNAKKAAPVKKKRFIRPPTRNAPYGKFSTRTFSPRSPSPTGQPSRCSASTTSPVNISGAPSLYVSMSHRIAVSRSLGVKPARTTLSEVAMHSTHSPRK